MTVIENFANAISKTEFGDLPPAIVDAARQRIFDTLGATAIGLATPEGLKLRRVDAQLGRDSAVAETNRIPMLVGATRATEVDDIDIASCTTIGSVVVPVTLCAAALSPETEDADVLTAIVVGYQAMAELGRAIGGATLIYDGIWPTLVTAPVAAAAATARLLRLDTDATFNALSLALTATRPVPPNALAQSAYRQFVIGWAAYEGYVSALAAKAGIGAAADSLEAFASKLDIRIDDRKLKANVATDPAVLAVDTKMFPSSRQAIASVEAFVRQLPKLSEIDEIDTIIVRVPAAYRAMVDQPDPPTGRIQSMIGVQYQMALAVAGSNSFFDPLRSVGTDDGGLEKVMAKVRVLSDDELSEKFPDVWGSKVELRWLNRAPTRTEVMSPTGSGRSSIDWTSVENKVRKIYAAGRARSLDGIDSLSREVRAIGERGRAGAAAELLKLVRTLSEQFGAPDG